MKHRIRIGKQKHFPHFKESWQDWTVREWIAYMDTIKEGENVDVNTLISLSCNGELTPKQIDQANAQDVSKVITSLEYLMTGFDINATPASFITVDDTMWPVPSNINSLTFGQANAVGNMVVKAAKDETPEYKLIPDLVAIWLDWTRYSDPKYKDESIENVLNSKCIEVVPVGFFFLKKWIEEDSRQKQAFEGVHKRKTISQLEKDSLWAKSGGSNLGDRYQSLILVDNLSGGDILRYQEIEGLNWQVVFLKLLYEMEKGIVESRINEIMEAKNKGS